MSLNVSEILKSLAEFYRIDLKRGWKKELAERMGVSPNALTQWERRGRIPPEHMLRLEREGVPTEHFLLPDDELMAKMTGCHQNSDISPSEPRESTNGLRPIVWYRKTDAVQSEGILEIFDDKETAVQLIRQLREIERLDPEMFQWLHLYCQGIVDTLRRRKKTANQN